jgi:glycosyltransferase involved in cell wall biosynthesis
MSTPHTTFLPGAVGKILGRTWIVDIFDLWLDNAADLDYIAEESLGYQLVAWLERFAFYRADHVIVLTPTMKTFYLDKYDVDPDRLTPVPFGVDADLFSPSLDQEPEPYITYVGNLGTFYAFEPYLQAFAQLDDQYELYIIGWGEERDRLEQLCVDFDIVDRVTFTGRVPREDVAEYLESAALNWVPLETDYELDYARPTKLLEGMAAGTPYVASPLEEIEVVTEQSQSGIVAKNEPGEIADAMERILSNSDLQADMSDRSVEFIASHHRWDELSDQVRQIINISR